jgi:hypothetical protein
MKYDLKSGGVDGTGGAGTFSMMKMDGMR